MAIYFSDNWQIVPSKLDATEAKIVVKMLVAKRGEINLEKNKVEDEVGELAKHKDNKESRIRKELLEAQVAKMYSKVEGIDQQISRLRIKFGDSIDE